ncbi:MAG: hypothetical protein Phog2KO_27420 [Phototrophicaceae bacterium]
MSDTVAIFVPSDELIPIEELHELTAIDDIIILKDADDETLLGYQIIWQDVQLEIRFSREGVHSAKIDQFLEIADKLLDGRRDKKAKKIWRRVERMEQHIECEVTPNWDDDRKAQLLVQGVMAYYNYAYMLAKKTIYNENGNIVLGRKDSKLKYWAQERDDNSDVPNERKKASLQILNRENVPQIKHLRNIPEDDVFTLRDVETVARRALALNLISRRADGESRQWFEQKVKQYQLEDVITDEENIFNDDESPEEYIVIMFSQRMEACWVLLWALNFIPNLSRPDNFADAIRANEIIDTHSPDQFLLSAKLRRKSTILDVLDLHFRYNWAVVDAELYGKKPPTGLKPDVVYQRHYALNWLTQFHEGQEWDAVTTDT